MDAVVDPVVQDLLELAKPSANLENTSDHRRVQKHAAVLVDFLRLQAERIVQKALVGASPRANLWRRHPEVDDRDDRVAVGQVQGAARWQGLPRIPRPTRLPYYFVWHPVRVPRRCQIDAGQDRGHALQCDEATLEKAPAHSDTRGS